MGGLSPERFALGAVMGLPRAEIKFRVMVFPGCLIPIRFDPADTFSGITEPGLKRRVNGPGQNFCIKAEWAGVISFTIVSS